MAYNVSTMLPLEPGQPLHLFLVCEVSNKQTHPCCDHTHGAPYNDINSNEVEKNQLHNRPINLSHNV